MPLTGSIRRISWIRLAIPGLILWISLDGELIAAPGERNLSSYTNDDGSRPDGSDSKRDDTSALRKALAVGPGIVRVDQGFYRWGDVQVPSGVTLVGSGKGTVIRSNGAKAILRQDKVSDWTIRDLLLDGEAEGDWRQRSDDGGSGLFTEGCGGYEVAGVTARNFNGAGFQFTRSTGTDGGRLERLTATGCYAGIRFGIRAEYITATQLNCRNNVVGLVIHAGNTNISGSNFCDNVDGLLIEDQENGSHGAVSNCLLNHNERYALYARGVEHGMAFGNCCFFYGTLRIENSAGVNITSSIVSCSVVTEGWFANRFAGNHVIPLKWTFSFGPQDVVEGNFTKTGRWTPPPKVAAVRTTGTTFDPQLHLFADNRWIDTKSGLRRVVNRAQPLPEPIVWPDDPLTEADFAWGNVIREPDGTFRLWYGTMMMGPEGAGPHAMAKAGVWGRGEEFAFHPRSPADVREVESCLGKYAESIDGLHWTKPNLGLVDFRGSRENNIILNGERAARQTRGLLTNFDGYTILRDEAEPDPNRRYKMLAHWESVHCWDNHPLSGPLGRDPKRIEEYRSARSEYLTYSPDGLRWDQPLERVNLPSGGGDRLLVVPDHRHARWMAYVRAGGWSYPSLSYSTDLKTWSAPEAATNITPASVQAPAVECLIPFNYGNQDLAFPCGMDKPRGIFTPMLASRHDDAVWDWVDNTAPFIPFGPSGTYCASGGVPLHNEPFIVGDKLLIFFNAFSRNQKVPCKFGTRSIGVATLRRDGFAGVAPATVDQPGTLTTTPVTVTGEHLQINVEIAPGGGRIAVELRDESNDPIPGFTFAEMSPINKDSVRAAVLWKSDLRTLSARRVRLSFRFEREVTLYAFTFSTPPSK